MCNFCPVCSVVGVNHYQFSYELLYVSINEQTISFFHLGSLPFRFNKVLYDYYSIP
ncbi:hypothetical protein Alsa2_CDS0031 [Staphylococcus phage Alsa_2]|nr:hypothetical protein Alsa2_CDS0031 [Staphylococcus phage Alsa_2]